jgi:hypothetical protein
MTLLALVLLAAAPSQAPLTAEEKAEFNGAPCKFFQDAVKAGLESAPSAPTPDEKMAILNRALKRPANVDEAKWNRCLSLYERGMADYRAATIEVEAKVNLKTMARGMKLTWEENKRLCPSSTHPVPTDLKLIATNGWLGTAADWSDAVWSCLSFPVPQGQRFQYEAKTDFRARTFVFTARGFPRSDGALVTWTLEGKAVGAKVEFGEPVRKP